MVVTSPTSANSALLPRSEEHTSELQSPCNLVCGLLLEKTHWPANSAIFQCRITFAIRCRTGTRRARKRPHAYFHGGGVLDFGVQRLYNLLFFFNHTAPTEIYTLPLHDALPILAILAIGGLAAFTIRELMAHHPIVDLDRKSTRLNSSHLVISYAVFWLKKTAPGYKHRSGTTGGGDPARVMRCERPE